ncbi:MAG: ATP-dependent Clp protease ATP-binding subunit [bacterium]|nr:ATP-dependent Clp protease ATP-binding subunit [Acidimicrobiia bacterium]MCY4651097.1 ATP-dependent Clp protease ATP-binding subunit [bacterium]
MFERFTDRARRVVVMAQEEARKMNHKYIGTEHLLLGLLAEGEGVAAKSLGSLGIDLNSTRETVIQTVGVGQQAPTGHIPFTPRAKKVLELALREALQLGHNYIGTEHILLGLIREGEGVAAQVLGQAEAGLQKIRQTVLSELSGSGGEGSRGKSQSPPQAARTGASREGHRSGSSILDQFGRNLTHAARERILDPVIGRSREIDRMMQILARRTKNNPVLIGEPGVGKSAIVEGLAQRIVAGEVPRSLSNQTLYTIDLGAMVAGTRYRGDFEERMKKVLKEIRKRGNVIIFLDEIHTVVGAGAAEGAIDAASILKPMLARGELQTIGATTLDEYRKHFERDSALARRFQPVQVDEPSIADAVEILMGLKDRYESFHQVVFTDEAIVTAVHLADRYVSDRFLPDKAIDLMDEAGSRKKLYSMSPIPEVEQLNIKLSDLRLKKKDAIESDEFEKAAELRDQEKTVRKEMEKVIAKGGAVESGASVIDEEEIAEVLAQWTGIPVHRLTEEETSRLVNMEEELHRRIVAQDDAIAAVSRAIRRTRAGLKDPKRPAGSFIFLGPSGVGKTETAKALTEFLFGNEDSLVQIDMSEYMEKHAVSRLIGSPPGYVGYDEGGQLTEAVRRRPFSVVLFDEIEKAHADVFNILLQILEDGRLTDSHGKSVDFKNVVIIMTSNLGTKELRKKSVGFHNESSEVSYEHMRNKLFDELKRHFRPEFLNRIDEIIVFRELTFEEIKQIIDLLMVRIQEQLRAQRLDVVLADSAKGYLAKVGYDPDLGARPLRRAIQRYVEDPLSEKVLVGDFNAGTTILVSLDEENDELVLEGFDVSPPVEAASSG